MNVLNDIVKEPTPLDRIMFLLVQALDELVKTPVTTPEEHNTVKNHLEKALLGAHNIYRSDRKLCSFNWDG